MLIRASILLALVTILFVAPTKESAAQGALKYVFAQLAERDVPTPRDPLGTEADYNHILSRWQAINRAFSGQASGLLHGHFAGLPYKNTYTYEEYKQLIAPKPPPQSWNEAEDQYTRDLEPSHLRNWIATDPSFQAQAAHILHYLHRASPLDEAGTSLQTVGEAAIGDADMAFASGKIDEANFDYSIARASAEWLSRSGPMNLETDNYESRWWAARPSIRDDPATLTLTASYPFIPINGVSRALYQAFTGIDLITGEPLSSHDQGLAVFAIALMAFHGNDMVHAIEIARRFISVSKNSEAAKEVIVSAAFFTKIITVPRARFFIVLRVSPPPQQPLEELLGSSIEMLMKAESGPLQRAQALGTDYSHLVFNQGLHPESFQLKNEFVFNVWLNQYSIIPHDLGMAFVGVGATQSVDPINPTIDIYQSADGRRVYRESNYQGPVLTKYTAPSLEVFAPASSGRTAPLSVARFGSEF
jgi:hypothetical protein